MYFSRLDYEYLMFVSREKNQNNNYMNETYKLTSLPTRTNRFKSTVKAFLKMYFWINLGLFYVEIAISQLTIGTGNVIAY